MQLENKVAIVTGASRGIGAAIATSLAEAGATVIGTATTSQGAEMISVRLREQGYKGEGMALDVTDGDSIAAVLKEVQERYGAPQILVNNAGITKDNLLMRMSDDEWLNVINTNLNSAFRMSKACLRGLMKARWGRIINISSVISRMGNPGQANYSASKAGVEGFTRALAKEVGSRNVTVNAVAPGFIDTDMTRELSEEHKAFMLSGVSLNRLGTPQEVAGVVRFLCSDEAAYITGETIHVNGGLYTA